MKLVELLMAKQESKMDRAEIIATWSQMIAELKKSLVTMPESVINIIKVADAEITGFEAIRPELRLLENWLISYKEVARFYFQNIQAMVPDMICGDRVYPTIQHHSLDLVAHKEFFNRALALLNKEYAYYQNILTPEMIREFAAMGV